MTIQEQPTHDFEIEGKVPTKLNLYTVIGLHNDAHKFGITEIPDYTTFAQTIRHLLLAGY